jgi:hypothetical protein
VRHADLPQPTQTTNSGNKHPLTLLQPESWLTVSVVVVLPVYITLAAVNCTHGRQEVTDEGLCRQYIGLLTASATACRQPCRSHTPQAACAYVRTCVALYPNSSGLSGGTGPVGKQQRQRWHRQSNTRKPKRQGSGAMSQDPKLALHAHRPMA